jgi:phytoene desaturase
LKRAVVIGAGFGGLALAIRLQSAGIETTIIESRDKPGGRAYHWVKDGFTFDAGPTVITDPDCLEQLWALSGREMADDVTLLPVFPFYRINWPDGTNFDYSNREDELRAEIAKLNPEDVAGYEKFLEFSAYVYEEGYKKLGTVAFLDFKSMIAASAGANAVAAKRASTASRSPWACMSDSLLVWIVSTGMVSAVTRVSHGIHPGPACRPPRARGCRSSRPETARHRHRRGQRPRRNVGCGFHLPAPAD